MEHYKKYKDSCVEWIGDIPEGWEVKKVKYLLAKTDGIKIGPFGSSLKLSTLTSSGIKIYGQGNIIKDDFKFGTRYLHFERFEKEFMQYEILEDDVLITMMGTTGKVKIFKNSYERGILDSHLLRLRLNHEIFSNELFVKIFQDSKYIYNQIRFNSKGSIMEGLNSSIVKELGMIVPPFTDQTTIANYLDQKTSQIDELIAQKERLIELYEEEKTAIINQAVTKGINPDVELKDSGIEWLGEIPVHWQVTRLNRLIRVKDGTHETPSYINESENSYPLVTSKDFEKGQINFDKTKHISEEDHKSIIKRSDTEKNDIIMSMIGGNIGNLVLVSTAKKFSVKNVALFKTSHDYSIAKHLFFILKSSLLKIQIDMNSRGGAQSFLSLDDLRSLIYFVLPHDEIQSIILYVETETARVNDKIEKTQKMIELQKEYRTALISEVVTGKIKVTQESAS
jgi:type I restriction enzyme, S subunit